MFILRSSYNYWSHLYWGIFWCLNLFLYKKIKVDDVLSAWLVFDHRRYDKKISLGFFGFKNLFSIYFHLKTSNKNPYYVNKSISQLKTPINHSKKTQSNWKKILFLTQIYFSTIKRSKTISIKLFLLNKTCWHQDKSFFISGCGQHTTFSLGHRFPISFFILSQT
jgi:hypothetical protein